MEGKNKQVEFEEQSERIAFLERELEIEVALERVRAKTMAMVHSSELATVVDVMFDQLKQMGVALNICFISIIHFEEEYIEVWISFEGVLHPKQVNVPFKGNPKLEETLELWKSGAEFIHYTLDEEAVKVFNYGMHYLTGDSVFIDYGLPKYRENLEATNKFGSIGVGTDDQPAGPEAWKILPRYAKVIEQTYTRFLDLKKAEAQVREAEIETAIERVRTRSMAMQKSNELVDVATVMYGEFNKLGLTQFVSCGFTLIDVENKKQELWAAQTNTNLLTHVSLPLFGDQVLEERYLAWEKQEPILVQILDSDQLAKHQEIALPDENLTEREKEAKQDMPETTHFYIANFSKGYLIIIASELLEEEYKNILCRFAKVFEQTYTRFLDLEKSEAQAREAQIEAALERVRSRSMAMHRSEELQEVIQLVFEQFRILNFTIDSAQFDVNFRESDDLRLWTAVPGQPYSVLQHIPYFDSAVFNDLKMAKERGDELYSNVYTCDEKNEFFDHFFKHIPSVPDDRQAFILNSPGLTRSLYLMDNICLALHNYQGVPYSDAEHSILRRFGKVFEQTYTRFLDLQKAEKQTREAQIEAALERVRSRTMAMYDSSELGDLVATLFRELSALEFKLSSCIIWVHSQNNESDELWVASNELNKPVKPIFITAFHPEFFKSVIQAWKAKDPKWIYSLEGKDKSLFQKAFLKNVIDLPIELKETISNSDKLVFSASFSEFGAIELVADEALSNELFSILHRFGKTFDLSFTRFLDLKRAEAQAHEALKQSSMDRIRGEVASLRSVDDLKLITPLIWTELTTLSIDFIRCGIFILDEKSQTVQAHLSAPDGKSLGLLNFTFDANELTRNTVDYWRKKEVFTTHWDKKQFIEWMQSMVKEGQINSLDDYQGAQNPPESLHLHLVPFVQGIMYVGSVLPLNKGDLDLIVSVAEAFSMAYSRYEDFKSLEEAKGRADHALKELQSTQSQLIQSEKMASLGELTAGIAHEIQNPLNFVNNFSEVSNELIDEMKLEFEKGDKEEAFEIANDIKQNLVKIKHHGQRAAAIVKGMLLHSRNSSGTKEPTDINALCDEYLRLAYHGLRAKDKSFNATLETQFDESIGEMSIVPQDFGRVILNLITNAFYAVAEKNKTSDSDYIPTVRVKTELKSPIEEGAGGATRGTVIQISIHDNGYGIPNHIKEKIFQPFFTTKPTGQGTGLGLSLAFDIVKAHGGELRVETVQGEGTKFVISLPV